MGLALRFSPQPDGKVTSTFLGSCALEGYPGYLHGGVIASLLDGAMTNCLFGRGIRAFTAELNVRYQMPVVSTEPIEIAAWLEQARHGLFQLQGEIRQRDTVKVKASGKFMTHE
jgi:acyl-coenzyme A thioesterase PaaI-like protein